MICQRDITSLKTDIDEKVGQKIIVKGSLAVSYTHLDVYKRQEVGSKVKKGDILCIVEAMKLMNEIESEFDGEVVEVCVRDGEMVDFGKPLFKLK